VIRARATVFRFIEVMSYVMLMFRDEFWSLYCGAGTAASLQAFYVSDGVWPGISSVCCWLLEHVS
jgi:hypothetical protein